MATKPQKPDSRYKWVIRDAIMAELYSKMEQHWQRDITTIIQRNCNLMGFSHRSFAYNGRFYNMEPDDGPPIHQKLCPDLIPDMKKLLAEFGHELDLEKARISGYLSSMLALSPYPGDYLALLPPSLHSTVSHAVNTSDWSTHLSAEKIASFMAKHQTQYELIRVRLALNLIL